MAKSVKQKNCTNKYNPKKLYTKHDESNTKSKNLHEESIGPLYTVTKSGNLQTKLQIGIIPWEVVPAVIATPLRLVD